MRVLVSLVLGTLLSISMYAVDKSTTWEGTLVDSNCYLKDNSLTGNEHMGTKDCGTVCLKSGLPAGLLGKDKKFHIIIARAPALAPYVGQPVRISGKMRENAIMPDKVEIQKNGKWEEVNIKAMM